MARLGVVVGFGARIAVTAAASLVVGGAALAAAYAGLAACTPGAPPGDAAWFRGYLGLRATLLLLGQIPPDCPLGTGTGRTLLAVAGALRGLVIALPLVALGWELLGWRLRLQALRWRGGHAVLIGAAAETRGLAPPGMPRLWLLPTPLQAEAGGHPLSRLPRLWRHALPLSPALTAEATDPSLGLGRAGLIVAAAPDDLANFRLARRALDDGFSGRLLARIEARGLRSLGAEVLRPMAEARRAQLTLVAPRVAQSREALARAMPGRYQDDVSGGTVHLALCGDGPQIDDLLTRLARQGYGLEAARPRISVLRLSDPAGATADEPAWADELTDLAQTVVAADDTDRIDSAIVRIATHPLRLSAVFCASGAPGVAVLLAERWERALCDLGLPVPPLLALDDTTAADSKGRGLVDVVPLPPLTQVEAVETRLDVRARAMHANYLALMAATGAAALPSHRPWATLPERYREDNRAASDHLPYKLARIGLALLPDPAERPLALRPEEIEALAPVEHARWAAARRVDGWTEGPRNDAALQHPDLVPYASLDDAGRDKDRDQVARLPEIVVAAGQRLARECAVRAGEGQIHPEKVAAAIQALQGSMPGVVPVLYGSLVPDDLALLAAARAAGHLTALLLPPNLRPGEWTPAAIAARRGAYRVRVTADPAAALAALPALLPGGGEGGHA